MTSNISDLLEQQGWHQSATLQCFKIFEFFPSIEISAFTLQLLKLEFSRQIHMQVTPNRLEQTVAVYINYDSILEEEVQTLLFSIENIYIEIMNSDT